MSDTAVVLLGVIAVATLVMATIQVGLIVVAARLVRQVQELGTRLEQDIRPLVANATAVAGHAARASDLAVAQMERVDRMFADAARRVEEATRLVQGTLLAPAREGRAVLAAIGAVMGALRDARHTPGNAVGDDDDPLFIG